MSKRIPETIKLPYAPFLHACSYTMYNEGLVRQFGMEGAIEVNYFNSILNVENKYCLYLCEMMLLDMKKMIKKILSAIFSKTGFHVIKRAKYNGSTKFSINDFHYDVVTPLANYAPWFSDKDFHETFLECRKNSMVDIYRSYELWELAGKINSLNPEAHFIEVGVWRGGTAGIVAKKLGLVKSKSTFYLADTFSGVAKASKKDEFYFGGEHSDASEKIVESVIQGKYENCKILKGLFPEDTAHVIPENYKFGFCHIDVDVYNSAKDIVDWIWDRMIIGGVIIFDDYGFHYTTGITKYVNEQRFKDDRVVIYNMNGHAVIIKIK